MINKLLLTLLGFLVVPIVTIAQEKFEPNLPKPKPRKPQVATLSGVSEIEAEFPGGKDSLVSYIISHFDNPMKPGEPNQKVYIQFDIDVDGSVKNVRTSEYDNATPEVKAAVIKLFQEMPSWEPAKRDGKNVLRTVRMPLVLVAPTKEDEGN